MRDLIIEHVPNKNDGSGVWIWRDLSVRLFSEECCLLSLSLSPPSHFANPPKQPSSPSL